MNATQPAPAMLKAAKYRVGCDSDGSFGVYMYCFDDETQRYETNGSLVSRTWKKREMAEASCKKWQEKEDKAVAKENKRLGF